MLKTRSSRIFSLTLVIAVLLSTVAVVPVTYAYNGPSPEVLFENDFENDTYEYSEGRGNTTLESGPIYSKDTWSYFSRRNNGLTPGSNTATARVIDDPTPGSSRGKILETFCLTPTSSTPKVDLRKYININNVGSAFDVQFDFKIPQETYDAMTSTNGYVEMGSLAMGGDNKTALAVSIKNKGISLTSGAPSNFVTSFPNGASLTDWNTFRIRFTTANSGTVYMNGEKIGTFLNAHSSGTVANFGFVVKTVFISGQDVDKSFYFDNFRITEAPVFSADFENVTVLDTDLRADKTTTNEIYYGNSVASRWTPEKFSMSILRPNAYGGSQNPEGNTLDVVVTDIGGTHGKVLKFYAGPMVGVTYDTGEVDPITGEPIMATTAKGEPMIFKQLQMPNPNYTTAPPLTATVKFSVYTDGNSGCASIRIADGVNSNTPGANDRNLVLAIRDGMLYSGHRGETAFGPIEKDEEGWSHYILTIDLSDLSKPTVDCVQNGKFVFKDVEFTHSFTPEADWNLTNSIYYIIFGGGPLGANEYTYFDDIVIEGGYNDIEYINNGVYAWDGSAPVGSSLDILSDGDFVGKVSIKNNSYGEKKVNLITAVYDGVMLETVNFKPILLPISEHHIEYISDPVSGNSGKTMKVFL